MLFRSHFEATRADAAPVKLTVPDATLCEVLSTLRTEADAAYAACGLPTDGGDACDAPDVSLRIGRECVITFPNFGNWRCRWHLGGGGRMPVSRFLPYAWYDTPNIHFCTVLDFEALCRQKNIRVLDRVVLDAGGAQGIGTRLFPNLFGMTAIFRVTR